MSGQHALAAGVVLSLALTIVPGGEAQSRSGRRHPSRATGEIETTSSVVLDRLSVKALGVDRPWDPRVCTGCDARGGDPYRSGSPPSDLRFERRGRR